MGILSRILGRNQPAAQDAQRIYRRVMAQSRQPFFFGKGKTDDTYPGRIDVLTVHMSVIMHVLRSHGDNGQKLSQALFDAMVDDFDIALRDEGLTDSGVKRRIKPMIRHFYTGLKSLSEGLESGDVAHALPAKSLGDASAGFKAGYAAYTLSFHQSLSSLSLGDIALARFEFPHFSA